MTTTCSRRTSKAAVPPHRGPTITPLTSRIRYAVTGATHGLEQVQPKSAVDLVAKISHDIRHAVVRGIPYVVEQFRSGDDRAVPREQQLQQRKFAR